MRVGGQNVPPECKSRLEVTGRNQKDFFKKEFLEAKWKMSRFRVAGTGSLSNSPEEQVERHSEDHAG